MMRAMMKKNYLLPIILISAFFVVMMGIQIGRKTVQLLSFKGQEKSFTERMPQIDSQFLPDVHDSLTENSSAEDVEAKENNSVETFFVSKNSSVYQTLKKAGISPFEIYRLVEAAEYEVNLAAVSPQTAIEVVKNQDSEASISKVRFVLSPLMTLELAKNQDEQWKAKTIEKALRIEQVTFKGQIESTLWDSASKVGLSAELIYKLSDIFAWQLDFERELSPGASWSIVVEKTMVDDQEFGWGQILAAEVKNLADKYVAVRFPQTGEDGQYYDLSGKSLKGAFLKSPLRYSRISSPFQKVRFHPILKINRPHLGVDYAAAYGTPVHVVGDGVVSYVGYNGGSGKSIEIKHSNVYSTAYKHLSAYSKNLKKGSKIKQGQVIGYVGATGLATGPHLHFEFYENDQYIDPLGKKFPRQIMMASNEMPLFQKAAREVYLKLPKTIKQKMHVAQP